MAPVWVRHPRRVSLPRALLLGAHRGDRLGHRLGRVGWSGGGGLDVFGLPLLALGYQPLDLALDLAGLARFRVVVGLLQRLRRLRLDGRLDRRDERLLVERARLLGVHRVDLGRLGLPGHVVGRRERGVLRLLRLRRGRRVRALVLGESLDIAGDLFERRILLGCNRFRRHRRLQQLVGRQRSSGDRGSPAAGGRRRWRRAPRATPSLPWRAWPRPCRADLPWAPAWSGAPAFSARPQRARSPSSSPPAPTPAASDPPALRVRRPPWRALSPFSTVSIAGSSRRISRSAASMSVTASSPGDLHPGGEQRVDRGIAGAALQRRQRPPDPPGGADRRRPCVYRRRVRR